MEQLSTGNSPRKAAPSCVNNPTLGARRGLRLSRISTATLALLAAIITAGCQSPRTVRIQQNPALFQSLDPFSQKLIREGLVNIGFSSELVIMALGQPNRVTAADGIHGGRQTWRYHNFLYGSLTPVKFGLSPGNRPHGAPSLSSGGLEALNLGSNRTSPLQPTLSDDDMPIGVLILDLLENCVVRIRIEP